MKIAVIGCGAMGSIYAGLLADCGNDVLVVDKWADHVEAINRNGLVVDGASGHRKVQVRAFETAPQGETVDLMVLAVKSAAAGEAARISQTLIGEHTLVLTIQNGLGAADDVVRTLDPDRLMVGIAGGFGAALLGPGQAHHNGMQVIRIGAYAGLAFAKIEQVVDLWQRAGFTTEAAQDISAMQWDKLICNVAYSAPCALTGLTVGEAMDDPELGPISRAAAIEAAQIAIARGIAIDIPDPVAHVRAFAGRMPLAKPSMLLDHEAGRLSEIDYINGAIPREAAKLGLQAPVNETLTRLVRMKERKIVANQKS
ncbi:ketopantoate reductase family protein [Sulfitobacter sp. F26204]|uniref:ketopantoate reductase family protein n=1 Tax=Sulfitobacter sp. F26204 TaxID=2996014 RepID=UPI00225E3675|nr:ketopantoate reductase family protein [Sulfitobacter sp. F26204]MCX7560618.1 ketopantoate reductase family protein [Sulfitobacter sp. F26204]